MNIIEEIPGKRWRCVCTYDERHAPKAAGFRWDPMRKCWWTDRAEKAAKLASPAAVEQMLVAAEKAEARKVESIAASRATDANVEIPAPDGLAYLPYQRAGIAYALDRDGTLIGDEPGLGKTIQAAGIINADPSIRRVLVVCPASLKINWLRELERWLVRPMTVGIANGGLPETDVVILNYDVLKKHHDAIRAREWDLLVCDEAHALKNQKALRTKEVLGDEKALEPIKARRRVFLTGTPIVNRPVEVWTIAHSLDPVTFPSFFSFGKRYCAAKQISIGRGRLAWDFTGASNLDELQEKLRASIMVRRLKKDVLTELPPKRRQVIEMPAEKAARDVLDRELERAAEIEARIESLRVEVELAKAAESAEEYEQAVAKLAKGQQAAFTEIAALRKATALAKVPAFVDFVREALEEDEGAKIVVFAHHHEAIDAIVAGLSETVRVVKLDGRDPLDARQVSVDSFQKDPDVRVFVGGIMAAGVGLTLTASSRVIFAEMDWVPGIMTQAEDRCHRIGQTAESVLVQHIVLEGSLDATIARRLVAKQDVIDRALDVVRKQIEREPLPTGRDEAATASASRAKLDEAAAKITPEQNAAIHLGLQMLAGMCDGASRLDNAGFSKIDVAIGHSLAQAARLTARQAALGARLVNKYRRQLPTELLATAKGEAA